LKLYSLGQGARRLYVGRRDHSYNTEQILGSEPNAIKLVHSRIIYQ
jgi:hypothetical protein